MSEKEENLFEEGSIDALFAQLDKEEKPEDSSLKEDKTSDKKDELPEEEIADFLKSGEEEKKDNPDDNEGIKPSLEGNSSPSIALSLALSLREKGVLTTIPEDKFKEVKEIEEVIDLLVKDREDSLKLEMNDSQKKYYEALKVGIPDAEIRQDLTAEEAYNSLTVDDLKEAVELQKNVYLNDLLSQGLTEEKAKKIVTNAENTGTLLEDSTESLTSLQNKSKTILAEKTAKAREAQENQAKEAKEKVSKLKDDILKTEEIAGYKLNDTLKDKIFETMTKAVAVEGKTPLNAIMAERKKDPVDFDKRIALFFHLTNGFKDTSNLVNKSQTDAIKNLKVQLEKNGVKEGATHKAPLSTSAENLLKSLREETIK